MLNIRRIQTNNFEIGDKLDTNLNNSDSGQTHLKTKTKL